MKKKIARYRVVDLDPSHNVYTLEKHLFWFFWAPVKNGTREQLEAFVKASKI